MTGTGAGTGDWYTLPVPVSRCRCRYCTAVGLYYVVPWYCRAIRAQKFNSHRLVRMFAPPPRPLRLWVGMHTGRTSAVLCVGAGVIAAWFAATGNREAPPARTITALEWAEVTRGDVLPAVPILLHGSPGQRWLSEHRGVWEAEAIEHLVANDPSVGGFIVTLHTRNNTRRFYHHDELLVIGGRSYPTADGPTHTVQQMSIHQATQTLWPATDEVIPAYFSANMEKLPAALARPLLEILPDGCLCENQHATVTEVSSPSLACAHCRDLEARLWLGAAGVSTAAHYDRQINYFLQASGRKRFVLLPPKAHRRLRLHPRWHGSRRQAQPDLSSETLQRLVAEHGGMDLILRPGEALLLPALWLHEVTSLSPSSAVYAAAARERWRRASGGAQVAAHKRWRTSDSARALARACKRALIPCMCLRFGDQDLIPGTIPGTIRVCVHMHVHVCARGVFSVCACACACACMCTRAGAGGPPASPWTSGPPSTRRSRPVPRSGSVRRHCRRASVGLWLHCWAVSATVTAVALSAHRQPCECHGRCTLQRAMLSCWRGRPPYSRHDTPSVAAGVTMPLMGLPALATATAGRISCASCAWPPSAPPPASFLRGQRAARAKVHPHQRRHRCRLP